MASFFRTNNYSPLSKRDTIGYYFDDNGEFKSAQPYELRPNFIYQNNKWIMNEYLKEDAAFNYYKPTNTFSDNIDPKFPSVSLTAATGEIPLVFSKDLPNEPNTQMVFGCYLKAGSSSSCGFWWGSHGGRPIISIDLSAGTMSGNTSYYSCELNPIDDSWFRFEATFGSDSVDGYFPPWIPTTGIYIACPQVNYGSTLSSWIPFGEKRSAD